MIGIKRIPRYYSILINTIIRDPIKRLDQETLVISSAIILPTMIIIFGTFALTNVQILYGDGVNNIIGWLTIIFISIPIAIYLFIFWSKDINKIFKFEASFLSLYSLTKIPSVTEGRFGAFFGSIILWIVTIIFVNFSFHNSVYKLFNTEVPQKKVTYIIEAATEEKPEKLGVRLEDNIQNKYVSATFYILAFWILINILSILKDYSTNAILTIRIMREARDARIRQEQERISNE